jgi:predicted HicB family RNase H-like nuclease
MQNSAQRIAAGEDQIGHSAAHFRQQVAALQFQLDADREELENLHQLQNVVREFVAYWDEPGIESRATMNGFFDRLRKFTGGDALAKAQS